MSLSDAQVATFHDRGYVLVPAVFGGAERAVLDDAVELVARRNGPEVAREKDGAPHVVYGMHLWDERLATLARHPRLLGPAEQLLSSSVFIHQSRVNFKQQGGAIVDWHQDFGTYHRVDGLPRPDGLMIAIFLDDITACNAPLMVVPRTQKHGIVEDAAINPEAEDHKAAAKFRYDIDTATVARLIDENGLEAITGPAGSILFMHLNVVHGSTVNITPLRRVILYFNVSRTDNRGESYERPPYLAARDFAALEPLADDCLLTGWQPRLVNRLRATR